MPTNRRTAWLCAAAIPLLLAAPSLAVADSRFQLQQTHRFITVHLPATASEPAAGRLLLFVAPAPKGALPDAVEADEFEPQSVTVAAQDVPNLPPGGTADIDADAQAYPAGISKLKPGDYMVQAVLDTRHDFAYGGPAAGDITSDVARITIKADPTALPVLDLTHIVPPRDPWNPPARMPPAMRATVIAAKANTQPINFQSHVLTQFFGRPITMHGWVLTPPGYNPNKPTLYPTIYLIHGYGASYITVTGQIGYINAAMAKGEIPPMIWVFPDQSSPTGTHEFADSVNNGPWGQALTTELIPALQSQYRMEPAPSERFLVGHSSGGWATLWLQTRYPALFGGCWSTAPDPSDFHDFININIYAPNANAYHAPDGTPTPLVRADGKVLATFQEVAQLEAMLGPTGGQLSSFNWVFSPRGPDGTPMPLFNRATGAINPAVAAYWKTHYDIANLVTTHWPEKQHDLTGKIHVIVGTADTFYLDGPAHRLQQALAPLHTGAQFTFIPGRTHMTLYQKPNDEHGLLKDIAWEVYKTARPNTKLSRPTE
jgi:enterochelin esterase-like enzyme